MNLSSQRAPYPIRWTITLGVLCGFASLAALSCGENSAIAEKPPSSLVLITMDTTRADHLGIYGYPGNTSPRIDALAARASVFTKAISQAAVTPVSHASILTGLYPYHHNLRVMHGTFENTLGDSQSTIAEVLRDRGYATAAFVSAFPLSARFGFSQGFEVFDEDFVGESSLAEAITKEGVVTTGQVQRGAGDTTDRAIAWLRDIEGPFFLWLHYFDPHDDQLLPPADFLEGFPTPVDDERKRLRALYDIEIAYMDRQIGRVVDTLGELGLLESSVLALTSDHGEGLGDHDWWSHGILYQEQIRVPLVIAASDTGSGQRVDSLVRSIDIAPTLLELIGIPKEQQPEYDGQSLVDLMTGKVDDLSLSAYSDSVNTLSYELSPNITDTKSDMLFSVILDGRWKYIHHLDFQPNNELYDLTRDPGELKNIIALHPTIARRARTELDRHPFTPTRQLEGHDVPEDVIEALRALGYTQGE
jgi:arylsulfatase A-like enzyme